MARAHARRAALRRLRQREVPRGRAAGRLRGRAGAAPGPGEGAGDPGRGAARRGERRLLRGFAAAAAEVHGLGRQDERDAGPAQRRRLRLQVDVHAGRPRGPRGLVLRLLPRARRQARVAAAAEPLQAAPELEADPGAGRARRQGGARRGPGPRAAPGPRRGGRRDRRAFGLPREPGRRVRALRLRGPARAPAALLRPRGLVRAPASSRDWSRADRGPCFRLLADVVHRHGACDRATRSKVDKPKNHTRHPSSYVANWGDIAVALVGTPWATMPDEP